VTKRQVWVASAVVAVLVLAAGCGGGSSAGGSPTPFGDDSTTASSSAPPSETTPKATSKPSPSSTQAVSGRLVIVAPGKFASSPAVGGFTAAVQVLFRARMKHNPNLLEGWATTLYRSHNDNLIVNAAAAGLVMRPPGRVVVRGVRKGSIPNTTIVDVCFGPTMAWYSPKRKRYTNDRPNGSPYSFAMYGSGPRWLFYDAYNGKFSCSTVKYPKG
jgi:hypothetical protein